MTATAEKVFPRGGRNPALSSKPANQSGVSIFNKGNCKVKKKVKKKKARVANEKREPKDQSSDKDLNGLIIKSVNELTPGTLQSGMLVLGIVSQVTEKVVNVSLPSGLRGIVKIGSISEFYKNLVKNSSEVASLKRILKIGDVIPARVISESEDDRRKFYLTLDPKLINSKLNEMEIGIVVNGSVKSKEEHGFIIDLGIPSISGFLNFKKATGALVLGQIVRCVVLKYEASNVELSMLKTDIRNASLLADTSCPIHSFIPGMQFTLVISKILSNGVEVTYSNNLSLKGYIHEFHLPCLFPKLDKIEIGTKYIGVLLYVQPLVNIPYFKVMSYKPENWIYPYGEIVKGKVLKTTKAGVMFRIGTKLLPVRCFVPFSNLKEAYKVLENNLDLNSVYPVKKVVDMIRLGNIDYMMRCYIGDTKKENVTQKYFAISDVKCGDIIEGTISELDDQVAKVRFGNLTGIVTVKHFTDVPLTNPSSKFKVGQKVKARVMYVDKKNRMARMTMKPTLLDKNTKILMGYNNVKVKGTYTGWISNVSATAITVKFFNRIVGVVPKEWTPYRTEPTLKNHYSNGYLVNCTVVSVSRPALKLSLFSPDEIFYFKIGEKYEMEVDEVTEDSLVMSYNTDSSTVSGIIPMSLLCEYPGMGSALVKTYSKQQKLTACHVISPSIHSPLFSVSDLVFRIYDATENTTSIPRVGNVYPFIFKRVLKSDRIELLPLVLLKNFSFTATKSEISELKDVTEKFEKYQIMFGKILKVEGTKVDVSLKLSDVWDKDIHMSLNLLDVYIDAMKKVVKHHRSIKENYLKHIKLGSRVTSVVETREEGQIVFELDSVNVKGVKKEAGEVITGTVVWINGLTKKIIVNTDASDVAADQDEQFELSDTTYRAKVLYVGEEIVVAVLKGKGNGHLVFLPRKRHINDFVNPHCPYKIGCITKVYVERGKFNNLVGIDRQIKLSEEKKIWKAHKENLRSSVKRKLEENDLARKMRKMEEGFEIVHENLSRTTEVKKEEESDGEVQCEYVAVDVGGRVLDEIKKEIEDSDECMGSSMAATRVDAMDVDIKSEDESDDNKDIYSKERILLSSSSESESENEEAVMKEDASDKLNIGFNWDVLKNRELLSAAKPRIDEESSSDDEDEGKNTKKKRVRLTKSEREEKARAEEERLRQIEERLMRADVEPETADDFDRALLAKPNSSALWVKYMAFHLQATEIEKARAVARRALKTISFNEEQEKLNVWVALLNLENLYGNEESLNKTLSEALMCNDPYHIHLHMLNMHGQSSKFQDMERVGNMLIKKFKSVDSMWQDVGLGYYKVGKLESARQVLQRALPLLEKKKHVQLISRFAQMENKYGSSERAQTLYETILTSFPKRVDIWSCYVDMLVKSNLIDLARQVLERATSQHLQPKKMKTLFKKMLSFEEMHGTQESVEKVRQAALEYVETVGATAS